MGRFLDLLVQIADSNPDDWWILRYNEGSADPGFRGILSEYDRCCDTLDAASWGLMQEKLIYKFRKKEEGLRGKFDFFNTLNETLAYRFLLEAGATKVTVRQESTKKKGAKSPDIEFWIGKHNFCCETKTKGMSKEILEKYRDETAYDGTVHETLGQDLLDILSGDVEKATLQAKSAALDLMLYLVITFDDIGSSNLATYRKELDQFFQRNYPCLPVLVRQAPPGGVLCERNLGMFPNK